MFEVVMVRVLVDCLLLLRDQVLSKFGSAFVD